MNRLPSIDAQKTNFVRVPKALQDETIRCDTVTGKLFLLVLERFNIPLQINQIENRILSPSHGLDMTNGETRFVSHQPPPNISSGSDNLAFTL